MALIPPADILRRSKAMSETRQLTISSLWWLTPDKSGDYDLDPSYSRCQCVFINLYFYRIKANSTSPAFLKQNYHIFKDLHKLDSTSGVRCQSPWWGNYQFTCFTHPLMQFYSLPNFITFSLVYLCIYLSLYFSLLVRIVI